MISAMRADKVLKFKMFRPTPVSIKVDKRDKSLGLNMTFRPGGANLELTNVGDGAIKDRNASASPETQVKHKDVISSVNGIAGDAEKMITELKAADELNLTFIRGPSYAQERHWQVL